MPAETVASIFQFSYSLSFIAGLLSLLSPCAISVIPAFLAIVAGQRQNLFFSSIAFFSGFAVVFVLMGLTASAIGSVLQDQRGLLIFLAGIVLIFFGLLSIFGKGFSGVSLRGGTRHGYTGLVLFGVAFAVGWSPCVGPILGGILTIAATQTSFNAALMLFFYALGVWSLLFAGAFFYERWNLKNHPVFKGSEWKLSLFGKTRTFHSTGVIAGLILIAFGAVFVVFRDTALISSLNLFNSLGIFFAIQDALFENQGAFQGLDLLAGALIIVGAGYWMLHRRRSKQAN